MRLQPVTFRFFFTMSTFVMALCLSSSALVQVEKIDIAKVWAGHPVNFAIRTKNNLQCVAYYDTAQQMIIAARTLGETTWKYTSLKTKVGWDSHNYIDMAIDDSGYIHVSGNMHNVKLIYFRSKRPWSIAEFEQPGMVGTLENSVTYPVFIEGPEKQLLFQYRIGGSGDGVTIWNGYDLEKKKWNRITEKGLFDNTGSVNAYSTPPALGPDSCFHIVWMWRDSYIANTNHDLSHMKSYDLVNWKNMAGKSVSIPVGQNNKDVVVDPVPSGRGLINMDFWISWDTQDRAVVTYHRYNDKDVSQIFNTRWQDGHWKIYQTSSWTNFKWYLDLQGSLTHDIAATPLSVDENGELVQDYVYRAGALRRWVLDEETLRPKSDKVYTAPGPMQVLYKVESPFEGMQVNFIQDGEYYIRWETMPINQDQARAAGTYPSSSTLQLYRFAKSAVATLSNASPLQRNYCIKVDSRQINIRYSSTEDKTAAAHNIVMTSLNGHLVFKRTVAARQFVIPVSDMSNGVYILKVTSLGSKPGETSQMKHIVIQH